MEVDTAYCQMAMWITDLVIRSERPTMLVGPMQGALLAVSEMVRRVQAPVCYRLVKVSLYDAKNQAGENATFDFWPISEFELGRYDFIVVDDVAESLRTFEAMKERLAVREANVLLTTLINKPTKKRSPDLRPDFSTLMANEDEWLIGEGMNSGDSFEGEACRSVRGVWVKDN